MDREIAEKRAKELVSKMTLEEKAAQLKYDAPAVKRLAIPAYNWWGEALHGVARAGMATVFPQAIGLAAMFDEELLQTIGDAVATEARAKYNAFSRQEDRDIYKGLTFWSPNVNIFRDPRWGRGHETFGEDPYLTARLGVAYIKGLQGDSEHLKVAACVKHFAVHSGPEGVRHEFNAAVSKKDMEETYLPAFEACVKEGKVEAVMGAYNRTNGEPCCASPSLQRILREQWGFEGHYVSDCWAIADFHMYHHVTHTAEESAALALKNGTDVNCGCTYLYLLKAYQKGMVTEEEITKAAVRLFTTRYMLGELDGSEYDKIPYEVVECREHLMLSLEAAKRSIVLLKNDGILPLDKKKIKTIGVIGPNADSRRALVGNYYGTSSRYVTVQEGIQDEAGDEIRVMCSEGCHLWQDKVEGLARRQDRISEAVTVAEHSDVVILVLGLDESLEGEEMDQGNHAGSGDKPNLKLPEVQQELLEKVAGTGTSLVVVMMTGSAVDLTFADEHTGAVLQAWYPGAKGGKAVADILFGRESPSGKLPVTFYQGAAKLPDFEDYSMKGRTYRYLEQSPLYPFGYGLTYGNVTVCGVKLNGQPAGDENENIQLEVTVKNEGEYDTGDVIEVYIKDLESAYAVKNHSLCGFKRVFLKQGEKQTVDLTINSRAMTVVDEEGQRYIDSQRFVLYVGTSQPDERSVELTGRKPIEVQIHR